VPIPVADKLDEPDITDPELCSLKFFGLNI
jgi:hypothetical protein